MCNDGAWTRNLINDHACRNDHPCDITAISQYSWANPAISFWDCNVMPHAPDGMSCEIKCKNGNANPGAFIHCYQGHWTENFITDDACQGTGPIKLKGRK